MRLSLCWSQDEPSLAGICLTDTSAVLSCSADAQICSHIMSPFTVSLLGCSAILISQGIATIKSHLSFGFKGSISLGSGDQEVLI